MVRDQGTSPANLTSKPTTDSSMQDPIKEKFERAPFIKYARGENSGLVGFHKELAEDEIAYIKDTIKTINSNTVTWSIPEGSSIHTSSF